MATAMNVAELFLSWANRDGDLITNLKMQKLLYYAQAWYVVNLKNKSLFNEVIEAWELGPVIPIVYHYFKKYGYNSISYIDNGNEEKPFTPAQLDYLKQFYGKFIGFSAHALVNMSHNEGPWKNTFKEGETNKVIPNSLMKSYYSTLI